MDQEFLISKKAWKMGGSKMFIEVDKKVKKLLEVTKESLYRGIEKLKAGNRIGDISSEIQQYTESHGYGVVRELVGHGLGKSLHEEPDIPNFGKENTGPKIKNGLAPFEKKSGYGG